ncbi:SGNH/GDSL hydrolase family protein [Rhodococcus sp. IEGM 1408]|uniref:SGNH/GDSL hydrolase family protein n=1 Tax=Rhodococcus sp. IEGM 1408 TaxID=3082220 RepID=UPI0029553DC3|nr:SGNH/GDSL hydrolase family protein [Rhodococcus sp. IEGM 1408]MDV7999644.1 SGNH/GDSL hydrolase family protein [Rhodococcus sp. IEGM 1408]
MFTSSRRRSAGARTLTTSLALAASVALAAAPLASAQSTVSPDGTLAVGSLGTPIPASGSLGSLAQPAYADYVALGDSYAAFGDQSLLAEGPAAQACARSLTNYPNRLDMNPAVGALTDATCGAAVTADITRAQYQNVPAQIDALGTTSDLVTLSIGGNDVGFGKIVQCITKQGDYKTTPNCETAIGAGVAADIAETFGADGPIDDVYDAIEQKSPNAKVVTTQYMPLMPAEGGSCAFTQQLNPADVAWAREVGEAINDAVDSAAQRNGHISVLPVDDVDRSACAAPEDRWTDFLGGLPTMAAPFHPTKLGQQAMADAIAAAL